MDKKLPNIFANQIDKKMNNVQELYYDGMRNEPVRSSGDVLSKIQRIFSSKDFVYKKRVRIWTSTGSREYVVVGRTELSLLTLNNETIKITDILDIEAI